MYLCRFGFTRGGGGRGLTPYGVLGRTYTMRCTGENLRHTVYWGELTPYGVLWRTYTVRCTGENLRHTVYWGELCWQCVCICTYACVLLCMHDMCVYCRLGITCSLEGRKVE